MKFKLTIEGDLDRDLQVTAQLGEKTVEGKVTYERKLNCSVIKTPPLTQLLPDPDDYDLEQGMNALTDGIAEFFEKLHGNV